MQILECHAKLIFGNAFNSPTRPARLLTTVPPGQPACLQQSHPANLLAYNIRMAANHLLTTIHPAMGLSHPFCPRKRMDAHMVIKQCYAR